MATAITTSTGTTRTIEKVRVWTASNAAGPWTVQPSLHLQRLSVVAGPDIDQAQFEFKYGLYANDELVQPLDLDRYFVRVALRDEGSETSDPVTDSDILATAFFVWYGIIEVDEKNIFGTRTIQNTAIKTGDQQITAFGLLRDLENTPINKSIVERYVSQTHKPPEEIPRGIPFNINENGQFPDRGNRSAEKKGTAGTYIFSHEPNGGQKWSGTDALLYTLANDAPLDGQGNKAYEWEYDMEPGALEWFDVTIDRDKRSVKDILDDIIDRRRALGYYVQGYESGGALRATVRVFTFLESSIPLNDNKTIAANPRQFTLDFENSFDVEQAGLVNSISHEADIIWVRGAKITSTFSCWVDANLLAESWSSADEVTYRDGATGSAGYAALTDEQKQGANQRARSSDSLDDVFSKFVMQDSWDLQVPDSKDGTPTNYWVAIDPEGFSGLTDPDDITGPFATTNTGDKLWSKGAKFERFLPIKKKTGVDLSEYRDPFILFKTDAAVDAWEYGEHLNARSATDDEENKRQFSTRLSMLDQELGFVVKVGAAGGQQLIASQNWAGAAATSEYYDPTTEEGNGVDYNDMIATVCMKWDRHVEVYEISTGGSLNALDPGVPKREIFIDVPDARLDFLLPGTITDIDDGGTRVQDTTGSILRDDRERLERIAKVAKKWYGVTRQALTLNYKQLRVVASSDGSIKMRVGDLVTSIGSSYTATDVNSVVTAITFENSDSPSTTMETSFAHMDFVDAV